jgi:hypothetical protein
VLAKQLRDFATISTVLSVIAIGTTVVYLRDAAAAGRLAT